MMGLDLSAGREVHDCAGVPLHEEWMRPIGGGEVLVEGEAKEVGDGGEGWAGLRGDARPFAGCIEGVFVANLFGDGVDADVWVVCGGDGGFAGLCELELPFHVGLARGEPDFAGDDVGGGECLVGGG